MATVPFLSIVVPFHNSAETCRPLLKGFAQLDGSEGVELIFVDDGSSDGTPGLLRDFARDSRASVQIIERGHRGPGAARNTGLAQATGKFVWFVDSDDMIDLAAITLAKESHWPEVDLVVWDWDHPRIVQRLAPGLHSTSDGPAPPEVLDPIVCNWFSRAFMERTRLRFPEYCFYEATPIESFVVPLLLDRYLKVDFAAYRANTLSPSITRSSNRFATHHYDCLHTVPLGMAFVDQAQLDSNSRAAFEAAFIRAFLWFVIPISPVPGRAWILAARIMRQYRDEARRFGVLLDPFQYYPGRRHSALVMRLIWLASAALPSQHGYFRRLRQRLWVHEIIWEPPETPARYRKVAAVMAPPPTTADQGSSPLAEAGP